MSCTRLKSYCGGEPLLPGSKEWQKHEDVLNDFKEKLKNTECKVDDSPPKVLLSSELNPQTMNGVEAEKLQIDMANKALLNSLAMTYQQPGPTVTTHNRSFPVSGSRLEGAKQNMVEVAKKNMELALGFQSLESDYDCINMAVDWVENRRKYYSNRRYKPDLWEPVFERQARKQALKGRELDPYYVWKF